VAVAPGEVVHTVSVGSGTPVVLVPGLFGGAYGYRKLVGPLTRRGYRVVVVEPLGTGFSTYPKPADYSLSAQADRIARALDTLGVRGAVVVGQAVGSSIAFRLAYRHPELVRGVLSIDGGPVETAATPGIRHAMRFAGLLKLFMGAGTIRKKVREGMIRNSGDTTWVTPAVVEGYTAGCARDIHRTIDAFHGMARAREPELLRDHLASLRVPIRLLVGGAPHETAVGPEEIAELRSLVPDFAVDSVPGAGQFVHEEQPEAVVRRIVALDRLAR
jgi:pimeloyl-ACP methyl ester carboxylesterase